MRAGHAFFRRAERQLDFEIEATEPDHDPASGRATLVQPPTVSFRSVGRTLGVAAALGAIVLAWFGVVRPELRDAAERAVDNRIEELDAAAPAATTPVDTSVPPDSTVEPAAPVGNPGTVGEPVSYRIEVDVGIAQDRSEFVAVPPDSRFLLTDLVLQNPNGDLGTAQLLRNGDLLYEWDLGSMNSANEFQPRVSPLPFDPSDNIVLAVSCEVAGTTVGTGCEIAMLMGGVLVPADADTAGG